MQSRQKLRGVPEVTVGMLQKNVGLRRSLSQGLSPDPHSSHDWMKAAAVRRSASTQ